MDGSWIRDAGGGARMEQKYDSNIDKKYYIIFSRLYRILPGGIEIHVQQR